MTDRLIPDPVTARHDYRFAVLVITRVERTYGWVHPRNWLDVDARSIALDNAVALWFAGDRPRGAETKAVPL